MTIQEAFELYRDDYIIPRNQSAKTEENHFICMRSLLSYFGNAEIESLDRAKIRDWRNEIGKSRSSITVRNYVIKFRLVLGYLTEEGYKVVDIKHVPVPQREKGKAREYITAEEMEILIEAAGRVPNRLNAKRNQAVLSLLWSSGIRVSELCSLTINQALLDDLTISGKSKDDRLTFIDARTRLFIDQYLKLRHIGYSVTSRGRIRSVRKEENQRALFINDLNGNPLKPGDVQELTRNAAKRAGLKKDVSPHVVRHGHATNLLRNGCDLYTLSRLLGHQSLDTTKVYLHSADPFLKEQYLKAHSI